MPQEEVDEARDFLQWLDEGNYIFLGFRRYGFETRGGKDYLPPIPESGLGILRDVPPGVAPQRAAAPLTPEFSEYARTKDLLIVTKANSRSTVHRTVPIDRIGIKRYDDNGNLIGEDRFLGLFTSAAYSRSVREIPMLRLKAKPRHRARRPRSALATTARRWSTSSRPFRATSFSRSPTTHLYEIARGILLLQERQRVALFTRKDVFERFVSCYVFVPRDRYTPEFRERRSRSSKRRSTGSETPVYDHVTDSPLARGLFVVRTTPGRIPEIDVKRVEALPRRGGAHVERPPARRALRHRRRGSRASSCIAATSGPSRWRTRSASPPTRRCTTSSTSKACWRRQPRRRPLPPPRRRSERQFHLKIIHTGPPVPLSEIMPRLENMGLQACWPRCRTKCSRSARRSRCASATSASPPGDAGRPLDGEGEVPGSVHPRLERRRGERRLQPPRPRRGAGVARGRRPARLRQVRPADRREPLRGSSSSRRCRDNPGIARLLHRSSSSSTSIRSSDRPAR